MAESEALSYEQKVERLEQILTRLDDSDTPIDELAADLKLGAELVKQLFSKLREVNGEVLDVLKELEEWEAED